MKTIVFEGLFEKCGRSGRSFRFMPSHARTRARVTGIYGDYVRCVRAWEEQ